MYDPAVDIPGVPGADQTLWYVANDLDPSQLKTFSGSPPIGIEMQKTIWGYRQPGAMGNVVFISTKLINRSGGAVDSMYVGQWADGEIGDAEDDAVGCDTLLGLGYTFNGRGVDGEYGPSVPAVGYVLLAGPVVPGGASDSVILGGHVREGVRSLPLSSFRKINHNNVGIFADPLEAVGGDIQDYCLLRGRSALTCEISADPTTGQPTTFLCSGDPVMGTGWVDGEPFVRPGDRRMLMSAGPFTFAAGDTQEIVVAHLAAQGNNRLSSLTFLKDAAVQAKDFYRMRVRRWPSLDASVRYPSQSTARLSLRLDGRDISPDSVFARILAGGGALLREITLYDDGLHGDSTAGDRIFGAEAQMSVERDPVSIEIHTIDRSGSATLFTHLAPLVTMAGALFLDDPWIFSENLYSDGKTNPGENIRFGVGVTNRTVFSLTGVHIFLPETEAGNFATLPALDPGVTWRCTYDPANSATYAAIDAPADLDPMGLCLPCFVTDDRSNRWVDTLWLPSAPSWYLPVWNRITHISGIADGEFDIYVIDRRNVRDHRYRVRAFSPDAVGGAITISLEDSTDGRVLLDRHELPDSLGHNMPMTDGFKLIRGSISMSQGRMENYWILVGSRMWTWLGSDGLELEGFNGAMGNAFEHWPSGGVGFDRQRNVLIRFAGTDTAGRILNPSSPNVSFAHRYLRNANRPPSLPSFSPFITNPGPGFAFQDYTTMVPFAAFDQDTVPARRLMVGYLENNAPAGLVNGRYWPPLQSSAPYVNNTDSTGPCEWFFIFDLPYNAVPDPVLQVDISSRWTPLMWFGTPGRRSVVPAVEGYEFLIDARHAPKTGDVWSFNPVSLLGGPDGTIPSVFEVFPNYPNPFNAGTTIKYALPLDARVIVRVYNLVGQQVRLLVDGDEREGYRRVQWDGKNDQGQSVGSGVYFWRIQATTTGENPERLTHVGKMVLLR
jgi:hypothetical protein